VKDSSCCGSSAAWGEFLEKKGIPQRGGRRVTASAVEGGLDANAITSNAFELEWPLKSGRTRPFPEIDRAAWFDLPAAHVKFLKSQRTFLDCLADRTAVSQP
jgi:predicted NUDIX family NTP pyrophosphohydrolase